MQTLVAPTREEIDASHAKRRWLDVGGQSIRNLSAISNARLGLRVVLCITAIPFHLLYESSLFLRSICCANATLVTTRSCLEA